MLACGQSTPDALVQQAGAALRHDSPTEAITLATKAIEQDASDVNAWWIRARARERATEYAAAAEDYTEVTRRMPNDPGVWNALGSAHFMAGDMEASIEAFDEAIRLDPSAEPHHWQRGISYYYAERYEDGKKQFEIHRTVNPQDVENSVWHFLCAAHVIGVEAARAELIPIDNDGRIPMMQIYALFRGELEPADVLEAAGKSRSGLFYAHLYLGLYHEAYGREAQAREHMAKAANDYAADHYMWHVARVHHERFQAATSH